MEIPRNLIERFSETHHSLPFSDKLAHGVICKLGESIRMFRESVSRILKLNVKSIYSTDGEEIEGQRLPRISDEAQFHLTGYVNRQIYRYLANTNPNDIHELGCGVTLTRIIGQYVANEKRTTKIVNPKLLKCSRSLISTGRSDIAHSTAISYVLQLFGNRVISRFGNIPWHRDRQCYQFMIFSTWGYLKSNFCTTQPKILDDFKHWIRGSTQQIQPMYSYRKPSSMDLPTNHIINHIDGSLMAKLDFNYC
ncbi:hypothetical protein J6590_058542 [Homalodisca vitripennis]|nr:hypothetical protein J6590_058542 [Homalodisca vitripennis]